MTTFPIIQIHALIASITHMERCAHQANKIPTSISMHPLQWQHVCDYVCQSCNLTSPPKEMLPIIKDTIGNFHGMPVLAMAAPGVALHYL